MGDSVKSAKKNQFSNSNVESWIKWVFRSKDHLPSVSVYFLSKRYSTSPRFFPLYNNSKNIRIILFKGSIIPALDWITLKFLRVFELMFYLKFRKYKWVFRFSPKKLGATNEILNFDDPEYTETENKMILTWEKSLLNKNLKTKIICTTHYTKQYLTNLELKSQIEVLPQGHSSNNIQQKNLLERSKRPLKLVYASPYIDVEGDLHFGHINWDASNLIENIWKKVSKLEIFQLHLIGQVGQNAKAKLSGTNVIFHGLVSIEDCTTILSGCDLALYPRLFDNKRQAQKIIEYIGAGLPILSFNHIDCRIVQDENVGIVVETNEEFVAKLLNLEENRKMLNFYSTNSKTISQKYSWKSLALIHDQFVLD
jgi:glycosyltransferase involved in cell wall biosynthesis